MSKTNSIKIYLPLQEAERYIQPSFIKKGKTVDSDTDTLTEQQLIKLCLKGNRKAQKKLYDKHGPVMKMVCLRYLYDKSSAEDALNKAFLKVFTKLNIYKNAGSFEGWIRKIVVNAPNHKSLKVYPNPTKDFILVENTSTEHRLLIITDIQGRIVKQLKLAGNGNTQINISDLSIGTYILSDGESKFKLIVTQ